MKWIDSINFSNAKFDSIQAKLFDFAFIELFWKKSPYISVVTGHFKDIPVKNWNLLQVTNHHDYELLLWHQTNVLIL